MIVIAFAVVVIRRAMDGAIEWSKVGKGFLPLDIPTDKRGVTIVIAAFSAVVGNQFHVSVSLHAAGAPLGARAQGTVPVRPDHRHSSALLPHYFAYHYRRRFHHL